MLAAFNRRVQIAYRRINRRSDEFFAGVSGKLNRRNQPAFKPYALDQPALRKSAGSTCHISLVPSRRRLRLLCFARFSPVSSRSRHRRSPAAARPPCSRRFAPSLHAPHAILAAGQGRRHSACATTRARAHAARAARAPPSERLCTATTATPRRRRILSRCSHTPCRPRSRVSTPFTPQPQPISARQVFDRLPVRDGSRKEEGKGSCGREARSQADSCREGGRDGGQGRRGAGIRPCSSVPDQGGPQRQRQRPRQGYG